MIAMDFPSTPTPTDFTLQLPSMDCELMSEWLYEPGPSIPLTQEDVRRLYRGSLSTVDMKSESFMFGSLRAPSPADLQSLWDDDDSDDDNSSSDNDQFYDNKHNDRNYYYDRSMAVPLGDGDSSDADTDSTLATLHDIHLPSSFPALKDDIPSFSSSTPSLPLPPSPPPSYNIPTWKHSAETVRLHTYSFADQELSACLDCVDETLLCNPTSVLADVFYLAAVRRDPTCGSGMSRGSSGLERVNEEDEEGLENESDGAYGGLMRIQEDDEVEYGAQQESDEDEDEPELLSPVQTGHTPHWTSGVCIGNEPSEALSSLAMPPSYQTAVASRPRCFSPEPTTPAEVAYLFLRTQHSTDPKDSVAAFPTPIVTIQQQREREREREPASPRHTVKDILRGFTLPGHRRDRFSISTPI